MNMRKLFLAGSVFSCALAFALGKGVTLGRERWRPDAGQRIDYNGESDLQVDEELFAIDINELRESLRDHADQEHIARLRYLVSRDWHQIIADRGQAGPNRWKQAADLVNRRRQPFARINIPRRRPRWFFFSNGLTL